MKFTKKQQEAIDWLKEIQQRNKKDITLRYVNDYWRVCPASINEDNTITVHLGKVNMRTWDSLINKGLFEKVKSNTNDDSFIYVYRRV
jgi:hypothetical protein